MDRNISASDANGLRSSRSKTCSEKSKVRYGFLRVFSWTRVRSRDEQVTATRHSRRRSTRSVAINLVSVCNPLADTRRSVGGREGGSVGAGASRGFACVTSGTAPLYRRLAVNSSLSAGDDYNYYSGRPIIISRNGVTIRLRLRSAITYARPVPVFRRHRAERASERSSSSRRVPANFLESTEETSARERDLSRALDRPDNRTRNITAETRPRRRDTSRCKPLRIPRHLTLHNFSAPRWARKYRKRRKLALVAQVALCCASRDSILTSDRSFQDHVFSSVSLVHIHSLSVYIHLSLSSRRESDERFRRPATISSSPLAVVRQSEQSVCVRDICASRAVSRQ